MTGRIATTLFTAAAIGCLAWLVIGWVDAQLASVVIGGGR